MLLPESEVVGGSLDYFQWTAILRAVSANTAYHWVYKQSVKPWLVADLLILKPDMPRSLIACYDNIVTFLDAIGRAYGRQGQAQRQARETYARLSAATTREIFQSGLHEFITTFVEDNGGLARPSACNIWRWRRPEAGWRPCRLAVDVPSSVRTQRDRPWLTSRSRLMPAPSKSPGAGTSWRHRRRRST